MADSGTCKAGRLQREAESLLYNETLTNLCFKPANIWEDWLVKKNLWQKNPSYCHFNDCIAYIQLNIFSDAYDRGFGGGGIDDTQAYELIF